MKKNPEKKWVVYPRVPVEVEQRLVQYPPIFRQILYNRGITEQVAAEKFLITEGPFHNPFLLKGMDQAVDIIREAIQQKKKIVVFGDYDVDGVTATAILVRSLWDFGAFAIKYIPNRFEEGYGFSFEALDSVLSLEPDLVITVDCGVRSKKEIAAVKSHGIEVIVTDHHQPYDELPLADAIVCPKQPGDLYPNPDLAGVGIAYKLIHALKLSGVSSDGLNLEKSLDLVAVGTVADLAKFTPENRALVHEGLKQIMKGERPGLTALCAVSGVDYSNIKAVHIGFMLGPRLNAAGRLSSAESAYQLLIAENREDAAKLALQLDQENRDRQQITRDIQVQVEKYMEAQEIVEEEQWVLYCSDEEFNEGVVGLAASRLSETYYRPAIIGTIKGDLIRASCRSIPEVNITSALDECADILVQHGGHAMAAGLVFKLANEELFSQTISKVIREKISGLDLIPVVNAECEIGLEELHPSLIAYLDQLEPTGIGNPPPLFISRGVEILYPKAVGKEGDHLKFSVRNYKSSKSGDKGYIKFDAIAFRFGHLISKLTSGDLIDILYSFEVNTYNGSQSLQLNVKDIKPTGNSQR